MEIRSHRRFPLAIADAWDCQSHGKKAAKKAAGVAGRSDKVKRTLILDEDDLILVVNKDVVQQIDENRGELNRTEFVNFLIHSQLKEGYANRNYVDKEEFNQFAQGMKELFHNFFEFFFSYILELGKSPLDEGLIELNQKLQALDSFVERDEGF